MSDILYAGAHWIGPPHPDNYFVGRLGYGFSDSGHQYTITAIGLHHTATTLQGAIDTFKAAPASGRQHSAHFIVDLDGTRYQILDTDNTAFALGDEAGNCYTVNIEVVQTWDFTLNVKTSDFTDAQYVSVAELCQIIAKDNGFAVSADTVHGHNFWTQTTCPADLDIGRIISTQGDEMDPGLETNLKRVFGVDDGNRGEWWNHYLTLGNIMWALGIQVPAGQDASHAHSVTLDGLLAAIKAVPGGTTAVDLSPVLTAIADLKAHPTVQADPTLMSKLDALSKHLGVGTA